MMNVSGVDYGIFAMATVAFVWDMYGAIPGLFITVLFWYGYKMVIEDG